MPGQTPGGDHVIPEGARRQWDDLSSVLADVGPVACESSAAPEGWWLKGLMDEAAAACQGCPAQRECLAFALAADERYGVWGGTTEKQRKAMKLRPA